MGVDLVYITHELAAAQTNATTLVEGVPSLVVEVLSPNDTNEEVNEKIDLYLNAGVPLIWYIDPRRKTATVYRPGEAVRTVNEHEILSGEAVLVGFEVLLGDLFQ